jgi:hypothetical protein
MVMNRKACPLIRIALPLTVDPLADCLLLLDNSADATVE